MRLDDNIVVKCFFDQNKFQELAGRELQIAHRYNENYREKNPVICEVIEGNEQISKGVLLVCQYHHFEPESFYLMEANTEFGLFAIPCDDSIFGFLDDTGELHPLNGNVIGFRLQEPPNMSGMPEHMIQQYHNRLQIKEAMYGFKKNSIIFINQYADYEIVYTFNKIEHRLIKVHLSDIIGTFG